MKRTILQFLRDSGMPLAMIAVLVLPVSQVFRQEDNSPARDVYAAIAETPQKAQARPNPLDGDPDAATAGRKLFERHCAECHGRGATGDKKGPSLRAEQVQKATPGSLFWILTNGVVRRGMPVWSKLPEPQRWQIISYLKSLGASAATSQ